MMKNVAINIDSITQVKIAIAGKNTTLGKFYAEAAAEKIEREKKIPQNAKITFGGVDITDKCDRESWSATILDFLADENKKP